MATIKQKLALSKIVENGGNVSKAMREVGYSSATATTPDKLTKSKGFKELLDEYLPDDLVLGRLKHLVNSEKETAVSSGLDITFKLKGSYAAEKIKIEDAYDNLTDDELDEKMREIEARKVQNKANEQKPA